MKCEEIGIRKEILFSDPRIAIDVFLVSTESRRMQQAVKRQEQFRKKISKFQKRLQEFGTFIDSNEPASRFLPVKLRSAVSALDKILDESLLRSPEPDIEANAPKALGPRQYPDSLCRCIFQIIDSEKGNGEQLEKLVEFFKPSGEFDMWIRKKSRGVLCGPKKKVHKDVLPSRADDLKWLSEFKHRCKRLKDESV